METKKEKLQFLKGCLVLHQYYEVDNQIHERIKEIRQIHERIKEKRQIHERIKGRSFKRRYYANPIKSKRKLEE